MQQAPPNILYKNLMVYIYLGMLALLIHKYANISSTLHLQINEVLTMASNALKPKSKCFATFCTYKTVLSSQAIFTVCLWFSLMYFVLLNCIFYFLLIVLTFEALN